MIKMTHNYKTFKNIKTYQEFFNTWDNNQLKAIDKKTKERAYNKYVLKCQTLQRDKFSCQNLDCKTPESLLTIHHIKLRKNGGEDKLRNLITICKICHKSFHSAKGTLRFKNSKILPSHIAGHTFKIQKSENNIDWKKIKIETKKIRKNHKIVIGYYAKIKDWSLVKALMKFLEIPYTEMEDDI